jgi:hypothetical protein
VIAELPLIRTVLVCEIAADLGATVISARLASGRCHNITRTRRSIRRRQALLLNSGFYLAADELRRSPNSAAPFHVTIHSQIVLR